MWNLMVFLAMPVGVAVVWPSYVLHEYTGCIHRPTDDRRYTSGFL